MTKLQEMLLKLQQLRKANKSDFDAYADDLSKMPADVSQRIANRNSEIETVSAEAKRLEELEAAKAANEQAIADFKHHGAPDTRPDAQPMADTKSLKMQAEEKRIQKLGRFKALATFKGEDASVRAYRFAKWFAAAILGVESATAYCKEFGIELKAQSEGTNTAGGYLVPHEFSNDIIDLRETYGVFRQFSKVVPMMSETKSVPRRTGGLTVYNPAEGSQITESQKSWNQVNLVAKKFACLALYSSELDDDSMVNIGDDLAGEIAYAFSNKEDECGFNGDGTSTFFGITGVRQKLRDVDSTIANIKGLFVGSGNAYSELVLTDFNNVSGILPAYAETPRTAWFVSKKFWGSVMEKLAVAAGGVTAAEVVNGAPQRRFLGYPVVISQVMPTTEGNSQVAALFGDLMLASTFGDRRQITLAISTDFKFDTDQIAIRGTQRVDINVHDVGDTSNAGPIVGLITAAS
jgi:HK97 family phage major capsid protein